MVELVNDIKPVTKLREFLIGDARGYLWKITIDKEHGLGKVECITNVHNYKDEIIEIDGSEFELDPVSDLHRDMQFLTTVIDARFKAV